MEMKWHQLQLACPTCKKDATVLMVSAKADGKILFDMRCAACGHQLQAETSITRLVSNAVIADLREIGVLPPVPRKLLPPPPPTLTEQDKKDMKDMHIDPEDGGLI